MRRPTVEEQASPALVDGLNPQDPGIALLAEAVRSVPAREVLLVCSGDVPGVVAPATRLVLDVREQVGSHARAVAVTEPLADGPGFGHAVVWPRPHLGKDFTHYCLARGALALRRGGTLWCAVRKAKGADSITQEVQALMGEVQVVGRSRGYRLLRARRAEGLDEARARAHLDARYVIEDEALPGLSLRSAPGVFSRRELDAGTRQLIEHARGGETSPRVVLDLGCGVGPLSLWAAQRWRNAWVVAVDSNLRAVELARENAEAHGVAARVVVLACDGLPPLPNQEVGHWHGEIDLALVNPPTHADPATLGRLAGDLRDWLAPHAAAVAMLVVSRPGRMTEQLERVGARVEAHAHARYTVLEARFG